MDAELRKVLAEESVCTHKLSVSNVLLTDHLSIVNAESIHNSCKEHALSNEGELAVAFHKGLGVGKTVVHFAEPKHTDYWVYLHQHYEECDWSHNIPVFALERKREEAHVKVGVKSRYLSHDQFHSMPSIEF